LLLIKIEIITTFQFLFHILESKKKLKNMNSLRKIGAFVLTALIIVIGISCIFAFEKYNNSNPNSSLGFIYMLGGMLIFLPVFDYWLKISKRFFKVQDENKDK